MIIGLRVVLVVLLFTPVVATVYTYWTRTPQYELLHTLKSQEQGEPMTYFPSERTRKRALTARVAREPLIKHFAALQNRVLSKGYGIEVQALDDEGHTVVLHLAINDRSYALTFSEQPNGRWTLEDSPARADLLRDVAAEAHHHPLLFLARL
ncbi:MAG TPA: hypothetical protein VJU82_12700 [Acidobacteriaceae bacterium]|nr:hypothetical protein [Acidobacteriaceae bacterium]